MQVILNYMGLMPKLQLILHEAITDIFTIRQILEIEAHILTLSNIREMSNPLSFREKGGCLHSIIFHNWEKNFSPHNAFVGAQTVALTKAEWLGN